MTNGQKHIISACLFAIIMTLIGFYAPIVIPIIGVLILASIVIPTIFYFFEYVYTFWKN